jgi:hypothetical protein
LEDNTLEQAVPPIPLNVVEYLERIFPDKAPALTDSLDSIRFKSGTVHVVRHLRAKYEDQVKNFSVERLKENY